MKVRFNESKDKVLFLHETTPEYKFLNTFPAFLKSTSSPYYLPAKVPVLYNVVSRLKKAKKKLELDPEVFDLLNSQFKLKEIPSSFQFITQPKDFQLIALRYLFTVGSGGLLLDPGMGKSKIVLDYIALMGFNKVLLVCPKSLLFVWEDEIAIHRPELSYYTVKSTNWEKEQEGIMSSRVVIINYNKACTLRYNLERCGFNFIHLDEALIKDPKTERTKSLTQLAQRIPYRCLGSGTLINNSIMDVFCPVRFLEPSLVGMNYGKFLEKHAVRREITRGDRTYQGVVAFKGADEARSILESCCIVMTKDRWLKLPRKNFHDVMVPLGPDQKEAYYGLLRNYITNVAGVSIEVDNPLVMIAKLNQISNGFVYYSENSLEINEEVQDLLGEGEELSKPTKVKSTRKTLFFESQVKIEALRNLLLESIPERRSIIWFNMSAEYELISKMLDKEGLSYLVIKGGEKGTGDKVRRFNNDPSVKYLLCQAKSVNYGITVLGTSPEKLEQSGVEVLPGISPEVYTQVFYSLNFSLEVYLQQQDRIHRLGQTHDCDYYRIFALTPVEKRMRDALNDKLSIRQDMLIDIAEKLKEYGCEEL